MDRDRYMHEHVDISLCMATYNQGPENKRAPSLLRPSVSHPRARPLIIQASISRDQNGRERAGKPLNHFRFRFYYGKRERERNSRVREWKWDITVTETGGN